MSIAELAISTNKKEEGVAEAPARANYKEKARKSQGATIAFGDFHLSRGGAFSAPFSSNDFYSPKKEGGKFLVYFRFLSAQ